MSKTIVNTDRRIYWFDEDLVLHEITQFNDIFYNVPVEEPVNEGQFRNLYIVTNNYRTPKRWDGIAPQVSDLGGLPAIQVARCATMEINNEHVIFGNIAKYGGGEEGVPGNIDSVDLIINTVNTIIDLFGLSVETGYERFNKTIIWSDINRPEYYLPESNNQAGDLDIDEDGYEIIRIKKMSELNIVYKEHSIFFLIHVGLPFVYVKKFFTDDVGLLARNAIVNVGNVHYFVGHDFDIYRFDGVNLTNLSAKQGIRDYIISRALNETLYQTHAFADFYRKEIQFSFRGKPVLGENEYRQFDIVYNYENNQFFKRDSIARCGGYFQEKLATDTIDGTEPIDSFDMIINTVDTIIDSFGAPIDSISENIDNYGQRGIPKRKLLIGDRNGFLYLYNKGDSFNGLPIEGYFETGDEDYAEMSGDYGNLSKLITQLKLLIENQDIDLDLVILLGTRDSMDGKIYWDGPYLYKQDANDSGPIPVRADGVYHRWRIASNNAYQYVRILGYIERISRHGEVIR